MRDATPVECCFFCRKPLEHKAILPKNIEIVITSYTPCPNCKAEMDLGLSFFEIDSAEKLKQPKFTDCEEYPGGVAPTGRYVICHPGFLDEIEDMPDEMKQQVLKTRMVFCDTDFFNKCFGATLADHSQSSH